MAGDEVSRRLMTGGPQHERAVRTLLALVLGPAFEVAHTVDRGRGEELRIAWDGGAVFIGAPEADVLSFDSEPGHFEGEGEEREWLSDSRRRAPAFTVDRLGSTFAVTKEPVTGWRRVLWPVYRLLLAWNSRRGI